MDGSNPIQSTNFLSALVKGSRGEGWLRGADEQSNIFWHGNVSMYWVRILLIVSWTLLTLVWRKFRFIRCQSCEPLSIWLSIWARSWLWLLDRCHFFCKIVESQWCGETETAWSPQSWTWWPWTLSNPWFQFWWSNRMCRMTLTEIWAEEFPNRNQKLSVMWPKSFPRSRSGSPSLKLSCKKARISDESFLSKLPTMIDFIWNWGKIFRQYRPSTSNSPQHRASRFSTSIGQIRLWRYDTLQNQARSLIY